MILSLPAHAVQKNKYENLNQIFNLNKYKFKYLLFKLTHKLPVSILCIVGLPK